MSSVKRRILMFFLLASVFSCSAAGVYASTDCQRWAAEYRQVLLKKQAVRRVLAAKYRLHHAVQRRLASLMVHRHAPSPGTAHKVPARPRMGPMEALRRFELACGDLPDAPVTPTPVDVTEIPALGLLPPEAAVPPFDVAELNVPSFRDVPNFPVEGTPGFLSPSGAPPFSFGGGPGPGSVGPILGSAPRQGPTGPTPILLPVSPVSPMPAPVPEPGSMVLVLTGMGGIAGAVRRRAGRALAV